MSFGAVIESEEDLQYTLQKLEPLNQHEEICLFKCDINPNKHQSRHFSDGRWVCHINDIKGRGIAPKVIFERTLKRLIAEEWIKSDDQTEYPIKFLGKSSPPENTTKCMFSNAELNQMMIHDIEGLTLEKREFDEYILSLWVSSDSFTEHLPSGIVRDRANDQPFDYEITRYEKPFFRKLQMLQKTGMTFGNYRRRLFGGLEHIVNSCREEIMEQINESSERSGDHKEDDYYSSVGLIFCSRYAFHPTANRVRKRDRYVDYPEHGMRVEEVEI